MQYDVTCMQYVYQGGLKHWLGGGPLLLQWFGIMQAHVQQLQLQSSTTFIHATQQNFLSHLR